MYWGCHCKMCFLILQTRLADKGKHLCRPIPNGKMGATSKKEMNKQAKYNRPGGRKKLPPNELKTRKLQMHVTEQEFLNIQGLYQISGKKSMSDFIREFVTSEKKKKMMINQIDLIRNLDLIGTEIGRIGNNINQIAKYANIQLKSGKTDTKTMERFNVQMELFLQEKRELAKAYRTLVRKV